MCDPRRWPKSASAAGILAVLILVLTSSLLSPTAHAQIPAEPEKPLIVVGGDQNYPPFEFLDENGQPAGFNIDLMRMIGEAMGFNVEFRLGPWDAPLDLVLEDRVQVLPMFRSEERARYVDYTERFIPIYHVLFVRDKELHYNGLDDLDGKEVIVQIGSYPYNYLQDNPHGARIVTVATEPEALRLLASGEHDCALLSNICGNYIIQSSGLSNIVTGSPPLLLTDYCFTVMKGNTALLDQLNQGLRIIQATDRYAAIYDKWLGTIVPHEHTFREVATETLWVLIPLTVLMLLAMGLSWMLRRQVAARTRELVRVNRALKTLGECNQAIVKAQSESQLLDTLCRIMIGVGNYRMAWVGRTDDGSYDALSLAAIAGIEKDVFNRMTEIDRHTNKELKTTYRAIASGEPVIVHNVMSDPGFVPWRELAAEGNFTSAISLPLLNGDSVLGCVNIYSTEMDAFDETEVSLLTELAEDISYGITSLRIGDERDRAVQAMRESQKLMSTVFHKSPFGHILGRLADSTIIETNRAFLSITGYSGDEVINKTIHDFVMPGDSDILQQVFAEEGIIANAEIQFRRKNGEIGNGLFSLTAFTVDNDKYIVGFLNDITIRKQAEERIIHLNAVLRGIRNVNQLITREHDRDRIVQEACDLLVEARGFHSVCIGLFDDTGDKVELIVGSGRKLPVMKELLARNELPDCIQAILHSPDVIVRPPGDPKCRICLEPNKTNWRDALILRLEHDEVIYGFIITAVPIGVGNDPDEHELLKEVAGDIAFAIYSIGISKERDNAIKEIESLAKFPSENPNPVMRMTLEGMILYANDAATELLAEYQSGPGCKAPSNLLDMIGPVVESGMSASIDIDWQNQTYVFGVAPILTGGYVNLYGRNITERKRLEEQLRQSQKMEAIGRLAGGVAHDFNNMLSVIMGYAELGLEMTGKDDSLSPLLQEIHSAGGKAASLTRQLLAFSRKQVMQPEIFNFNSVINDMQDMLERLLGEDIDLVTVLAESIGNVKADPGQIEQVIMNLAVNSRDAMPTGGKLTIETSNATLDAEYAQKHATATPGPYVMMAVSDTGIGMDENILSRIFEPFFTTKHDNRGTGLGLATSYGIVKQSGGNIWVYSEIGGGTTFKIYLPRVDEPIQSHYQLKHPESISHGSETILVVEDEDSVRTLAQRILEGSGFRVLSASSAAEAEAVCRQHGKPVDLVLTDVVMPVVSGREMAERLQTTYPGMEILYMSGYTDNAIVHHGILDAGTHFIGKPFSAAELVRKIREVLDGDKME